MNYTLNAEETGLLSTLLGHMDNETIYSAPFGIFTKDNSATNDDGTIFKSNSFVKMEKKLPNLLNIANKKIISSNEEPFILNKFNVFVQKIANTDLFLVFIKRVKRISCADHYSLNRCCHDIQEPLRNISSFLQIINLQIQEKHFASCSKYIEFAIKNILTLKDFVSEILQSNHVTVTDRFNIEQIINEIKVLLKFPIEERDCSIVMCGENCVIAGNYFEVFSLFKNLIENSIRHAKAAKLKIEISVISQSDNFVTIIFKDNGERMQESKIEGIKQTLAAKNSTNDFGLQICQNTAKKHAGEIKFISDEDCRYEIRLPICNSAG